MIFDKDFGFLMGGQGFRLYVDTFGIHPLNMTEKTFSLTLPDKDALKITENIMNNVKPCVDDKNFKYYILQKTKKGQKCREQNQFLKLLRIIHGG